MRAFLACTLSQRPVPTYSSMGGRRTGHLSGPNQPSVDFQSIQASSRRQGSKSDAQLFGVRILETTEENRNSRQIQQRIGQSFAGFCQSRGKI